MVSTELLDNDGSVDIEALGNLGEDQVREWILMRLSGKDALIPIDPRSDENPGDLLVYLIKKYGTTKAATQHVSAALDLLMRRLGAARSEMPDILGTLLYVLQRCQIPSTRSFFTNFLTVLAANPQAVRQQWHPSEIQDLLHAARMQARGVVSSASRTAWKELLLHPEYTSVAITALAIGPVDRLQYLPPWWHAASPNTRDRELKSLIDAGLQMDPDKTLALLHQSSPDLDYELQRAIDVALNAHSVALARPRTQVSEVAQRGSYTTALAGAAHR